MLMDFLKEMINNLFLKNFIGKEKKKNILTV